MLPRELPKRGVGLTWDGSNYRFRDIPVVVLELTAYEHLKKKAEQDTKSAPTSDRGDE